MTETSLKVAVPLIVGHPARAASLESTSATTSYHRMAETELCSLLAPVPHIRPRTAGHNPLRKILLKPIDLVEKSTATALMFEIHN